MMCGFSADMGRASGGVVQHDLQQYAYGGYGFESAVGWAVSESVGDGWRRWNVCEYLDAEHVCSGGNVDLEYDDSGAGV